MWSLSSRPRTATADGSATRPVHPAHSNLAHLDAQQDGADLQRRAPLVFENVQADAAQLVCMSSACVQVEVGR